MGTGQGKKAGTTKMSLGQHILWHEHEGVGDGGRAVLRERDKDGHVDLTHVDYKMDKDGHIAAKDDSGNVVAEFNQGSNNRVRGTGVGGGTISLHRPAGESFDTGGAAMEEPSKAAAPVIGGKLSQFLQGAKYLEKPRYVPIPATDKIANTKIAMKIKAQGLQLDNIHGTNNETTQQMRKSKDELDTAMQGYKPPMGALGKGMQDGEFEKQIAHNQGLLSKAKDLVKLSSEDLKAKGANANAEDLLRHQNFTGTLEELQRHEEGMYHTIIQEHPDTAAEILHAVDGSALKQFIDTKRAYDKFSTSTATLSKLQDSNRHFADEQAKASTEALKNNEHFEGAEMGVGINDSSAGLKADTDLLRESLGFGKGTGFCDSEAAKYAFRDQPVIERLMRVADQDVSQSQVHDIITQALPNSKVHKIFTKVEMNKERYAKDYGVTEAELTALVAYTGDFYVGMKSAMDELGKGMTNYCQAPSSDAKRNVARTMAMSLGHKMDEDERVFKHKREALALSALAMRALAKVMAVRKAPPLLVGSARWSQTPEKLQKWQTALNKGESVVDFGFVSSARYDSKLGNRYEKPVHVRLATDRYVDVADISVYRNEDECLALPGIGFDIESVDTNFLSQGKGGARLIQHGLDKNTVHDNQPGENPDDSPDTIGRRVWQVAESPFKR